VEIVGGTIESLAQPYRAVFANEPDLTRIPRGFPPCWFTPLNRPLSRNSADARQLYRCDLLTAAIVLPY
jgi:hypothetical protein